MNKKLGAYKLLALVLVLSLMIVAGVAAQGTTPEAAVPLINEMPETGTLTGSRAGNFHYYIVAYPGDLRVVTIRMEFQPSDPVTRLGVGFNVYGRNGFLIGQGSSEGLPAGVLELEYSDSVKDTWLVQVYNYLPSRTISYSVEATGLPEPTTTPQPAPTPTQAPGMAGLEQTVSGSLTGSSAGAFDRYNLPYAGDGSEVEIMMTYTPDNPVIAPGVGFVVYGPQGEVARGHGTGQPTQRRVVFSSDVPGTYILQVYNYINGLTVTYSLTAETVSS